MASLTGKAVKNTYKDLLQISNSNNGIDGTLRTIEDGEGTSGPIQLSSGNFKVTGTFDNLANNGGEIVTNTATSSNNGSINVQGLTSTSGATVNGGQFIVEQNAIRVQDSGGTNRANLVNNGDLNLRDANNNIFFNADVSSGVGIGDGAALPGGGKLNIGGKFLTFNDVSDPGWSGFNGVAQLSDETAIAGGAFLEGVENVFNNGNNYEYITSASAVRSRWINGDFLVETAPSGTAGNAATFTEAFRVKNGRDVTIGGATAQGAGAFSNYRATSTTSNRLYSGESDVSSTQKEQVLIRADGDLENVNGNYGTISDRRVKKNIDAARTQESDAKTLSNIASHYHLDTQDDTEQQLLGWVAQDLEASGLGGLVREEPWIEYIEETYTETENRPVMETVTVTRTDTVVEDGQPVSKMWTEEQEQQVHDKKGVVDENGDPVLDENGNQVTYSVPRFEKVDVTKTRTVEQQKTDADGNPMYRKSVKSSILVAKMCIGTVEYAKALEQRIADLESA